MGLGSSKKEVDQNNEFYIEAFENQLLRVKGIDLNSEAVKTTKQLETFNSIFFEEETIDHADESARVKPWLENILAPNIPLEENIDFPNYNLKIDHVYGFKSENSRKNLFFYKEDQIIYSVSSICIIQNLDDNTQILFGGFPLGEDKECHDKDITAIAYLKKDVSMVATGQTGINPKILIWSPIDPEVIYAKFEQPEGSQLVSNISFDRTGRFLGSFGKDSNHSFYIFDLRKKNLYWEQETKSKGNPNDYLLDMCFNPGRNEICLVGVEKIIFANYMDRRIYKNVVERGEVEKIYSSCCYLDSTTCLVGTNHGKLLVFEDGKKSFKKKLAMEQSKI